MTVTTPPTGARIVEELVAEMEAKLYPIVYRTVPPQEFHVYVHPDDYREIESLVPLIVADAQRRLEERVVALNHRPRWAPLRQERPPVEIPAGGWAIFFHPDANDQLGRGQLGIVSRLSIPASPTYGGTPTVRIGRTVVSEGTRTTTVTLEATPLAVNTERPANAVDLPLTAELATLAWRDDQGEHVFVMRKAEISIGRGGSAHWVDVQVVASSRVSRRHCRIRRDQWGRFLLQDSSAWGTSVDGTRVVGAAESDINNSASEHELPPVCRIDLADAVVITFTARREP
jgi:hypothetical protein